MDSKWGIENLFRRLWELSRGQAQLPKVHAPRVSSSSAYWEARYARGGDSGSGSSGELANYKGEFIQHFLDANEIEAVIDLGCGDGRQLSRIRVRKYFGLDVSKSLIQNLQKQYAHDTGKQFVMMDEWDGEKADCVLSLDVIYHLVEDRTYHEYMTRLFEWAKEFVVIYSSNFNSVEWGGHVRHRKFTNWVSQNALDFTLIESYKNPFSSRKVDLRSRTSAEFFVYKRIPRAITLVE